uniref:Uncharacterized protein n=1 Tax=Physcomitrium patens TaxID=3218 RepID=A0A2K1IGG7_PHYPA|nr:hypothetical protein PHYPA_028964 [Physcomitrium patens]
MVLNNEICTTKQIVERKKLQTVELQLSIDQMLKGASTNVLAYNQICIAAANLLFRISRKSTISQPLTKNPIKNMDVVANFITDLAYIHKAYNKKEP